MSANGYFIIAVTGRASSLPTSNVFHVDFFFFFFFWMNLCILWKCRVVPPCQYSWRHDVMTSYDMTKWTCTGEPIWKSENHVFQPSYLDYWPMTLTFKPIRGIIKVNLFTKFWVYASNSSAVTVLNYRWTDRLDRFYTLDRWRRREKCHVWSITSYSPASHSGM